MWTDELLNEKRRDQVRITAKVMSDIQFDIVISNPLSRAYETAQIILNENKHDSPGMQTDDRIKELFFGSWEELGITRQNVAIPSKDEDFNKFFIQTYFRL